VTDLSRTGVGVEPQPTEQKVCDRCGEKDGTHTYVEGDCVLRHRNHSTRLVEGTFVCVWCVARHQSWLREILDLYATLDQVLEPGSIPDDTADHKRPKKPAETPSPVRLEAWALLFDKARLFTATIDEHGISHPAYLGGSLPDVPGVLTGWAQNACDDQGLAGTSLHGDVMTAVRLLTEHAEFIVGRPWVDTYDTELGWCRTSLMRAHGITNPRPLGKCLTVNDTTACTGNVWADKDGGQPRCDRCNRRYGTLDLVRVRLMTKETA
jgi:hypothetical protein